MPNNAQCQVVDDRLSALPDEILIDILQRLQLPTAARTTTLARRWTHLLQSMNHLEIDVADFIPRRSAPSLKRNTMTRVKVAMSRYTQAMRTLLAPRAESPQLIIIRTLHLCFYLTDPYLHSVGRMLEDAVQSAGGRASKIEVLSFSILTEVPELLCTEKHLARYGRRFMSFFQAYPNAFRRLTSLSLWALRFGDSDIPNLLASCLQLQHLTLQDCDNGKRSLPFKLSDWLSTVPTLTSLHLDFQDEMVWILPEEPKKLFPIFRNLRNVYLCSISLDCGLDWTLFVLEGAPFLERFHVKISLHICDENGFKDRADRSNVVWEASSESIKHKNLRLLDINGFETTENLIKELWGYSEFTCMIRNRAKIAMVFISIRHLCPELYSPNNEAEKDLLRQQLLQGFSSSIEITIG
uniref:F-box domain-containing protein n=1 Tax=Oryza glumipatula TaxID=40148 RepID=A0A0D9ZT75_9ORYZ